MKHIIPIAAVLLLPLAAAPARGQQREARAAVQRLIEAARIYDEREMAAAGDRLAELGGPAVPALCQALADFDDNVRWQAIVALGRIGRPARGTIPKLIAALQDVDADVRAAAAESLGQLAAEDPQTVAALRGARRDPHGLVRAAAEWALWELAGDRRSIGNLAALLGDRDWMVCVRAERHLGAIGAPAVPALARRLDDENASGRPYAAAALGRIGPRAAPALDALLRRLSDDDPRVGIAAAEAIGCIGPAAVAPLTDVLRGGEAKPREGALRALAALGPPAAGALPLLLEELDAAREPSHLLAAIAATGAVGPGAAPAVPRLVKMLTHESPDIRGAACAALGRIGPAARAAREPLARRAAEDPAEFVRLAARDALWRTSPEDGRAR